MKNKFLIILGISLSIMLTATQAINITYKEPIPTAVSKAIDLGMKQATAQAMFNDGVDVKDIRPQFVSAWKKDKQGQIEGRIQHKKLQSKMNSPFLKEAFEVMSSDIIKQKLNEKGRMAQVKNGNHKTKDSLSLAEIKKMMSNEQFMAYTDILWNRRTSQPLLEIPKSAQHSSNKSQQGTTLTVGDSCNFPNLLTALNFAAPGNTIIVQAKTFTGIEAQLTIDKDLTIIGGYDSTCQVFTADRTILQSNLAGPVIDIDVSGGKTVELFGLDISGSQTNTNDYTSGVNISGAGFVTIGNTHIHNNESKYGGGISIQDGADVIINQNTEIYSNHVSDDGGGIYCKDSGFIADDTIIGRFNATAQGNSTAVNGLGGAIYADNCQMRLGKISGPVELNYNQAQVGAAIYLTNSLLPEIGHQDTQINFNEGGSIISVQQNSDLLIHSATISDNFDNVSVFNIGQDSQLTIGSVCDEKPCVKINRNEGIAIFATNNAQIDVYKALISNNNGPQVIKSSSPDGTDFTISNSMIVNNTVDTLISTDTQNNGISFMLLNHVTIANNTGSNSLLESINGSNINLNSSIVWGNSMANLQSLESTNINVQDSVIQYDPTGMLNTIQQDPLFIEPDNNNWHIQPFSPAIDQANSSIIDDYDGDFRPLGNGKDAGADEYSDLVGINGAACEFTSVSQAINAASSGDMIYITKGEYKEQLPVIHKDLDFVSAINDCSAINDSAAKSDVVLNGNNQYRLNGGLLNVNGGSKVSISNMTLTNAQGNVGGIIFVAGELTLNDVIVTNGTADSSGGNIAINDVDSTLILNGDTIISSGFGASHGGGIFSTGIVIMNDNSKIGIEDFGNVSANGGAIACYSNCSLFLNDNSSIFANMASENGGGVIVGSGSTVTLNDDSSIGSGFLSTANRSVNGGGVYLFDNPDASFKMYDNSKIQHNIATEKGGGLFVDGRPVLLESGKIFNNRIDSEQNQLAYGAGIYASNSNQLEYHIEINEGFSIMSNQFTDSNMDLSGGGIYAKDINTHITINEGVIDFNVANQGGGISIEPDVNLILNQAEVKSNSAIGDFDGVLSQGGGLYIDALSSATIHESSFNNNQAQMGAGIYTDGSTLTLNGGTTGTQFNNNNANISGGGIYAKNASINISGPVTFTLNSSDYGGAIYLEDTNLTNSVTAAGSIIFDNNNASNGGGIYTTGEIENNVEELVFDRPLFTNNSASQNGGALSLNYVLASFKNANFIQNDANNGGAIHLFTSEAFIVPNEECLVTHAAPNYCSNFTGNSANTAGSILYLEDHAYVATAATVYHNNPTNPLGAINLGSNSTEFSMDGSLMFNNGDTGIVNSDGGRINVRLSTLVNSGVKITNNHPDSRIDSTIMWDTVIDVPFDTQGECNISPNGDFPNSLADDPLFETTLTGPFHLSSGSPAIDKCDGLLLPDLDGRFRPIDNDGFASNFEYDMGAYERPIFGTLTVNTLGSGIIVSNIPGINCGSDCSDEYELNSQVELTATPDEGFVFGEWTGACAGQSSVCNLTIDGATQTQAVFIAMYSVTVSVGGHGPGLIETTIPGISCGAICEGSYIDGTEISLNATSVDNIHVFDRWQGACQGQAASCQLTVDSDLETQAIFINPDIIFNNSFD